MAKKQIPKDMLDEIIDCSREFWHGNGYPGLLERVICKCMQIQAETGINWFSLQNLIDAILPVAGVKYDATNEDIYAVLRLLGWEVSDERSS